MLYKTVINMVFDAPKERVFEALINLEDYHLWNSGLINITGLQVMEKGKKFRTRSIVAGREIVSETTVEELRPNEEIVLSNVTGTVPYRSQYILRSLSRTKTEMICQLEFELRGLTLNYAHKAVESMAHARTKGDMEALNAILSQEK